MSIIERTTYTAACDGCDARSPPQASALNAVVWAANAGWTAAEPHGVRVHLCTACAAKDRPDWWPREDRR